MRHNHAAIFRLLLACASSTALWVCVYNATPELLRNNNFLGGLGLLAGGAVVSLGTGIYGVSLFNSAEASQKILRSAGYNYSLWEVTGLDPMKVQSVVDTYSSDSYLRDYVYEPLKLPKK